VKDRIYAPRNGKAQAGQLVYKAKADGLLPFAKNCICVDCGEPACDLDHRDYNKPLQVDPVCRRCNLRRGPAIPFVSAFRETVAMGILPYSKRISVVRVFNAMGANADFLLFYPKRLALTHWVHIVPEFERAYALYESKAST
jgi:hypothetical protein